MEPSPLGGTKPVPLVLFPLFYVPLTWPFTSVALLWTFSSLVISFCDYPILVFQVCQLTSLHLLATLLPFRSNVEREEMFLFTTMEKNTFFQCWYFKLNSASRRDVTKGGVLQMCFQCQWVRATNWILIQLIWWITGKGWESPKQVKKKKKADFSLLVLIRIEITH